MPDRPVHTHIRLKRIALFVIIHSLIPLVLLSLVIYVNQRNLAIDTAKRDANFILEVASRTYQEKIVNTQSILETMVKIPEVINGQAGPCNEVLGTLLKQFPSYSNFGVTDNKGLIYCSGLPITQKVPAGDRLWYLDAVKNKSFSVGIYQIGRITKRPGINFGYPIGNGKITGVVFAALDLNWIKDVADNFNLPKNSTITVIDREGTVLARFPAESAVIGTNQKDNPLVKKVLENGPSGSFISKGLDNIERYYFYSKIQESTDNGDFFLYIGIPTSELTASANFNIARNFLILLAAISLTLVTAYFDWKLFLEKEPVSP